MTASRSVGLMVALAALAGCTAFLPQVDVRDEPDPGSAYVYGRFTKVVQGGAPFSGTAKGLVLVIKCAAGSEHLIDFSEDQPLKMIKLTPSACALDEFALTDAFGMPMRKLPISDIPRKIDLAAGKAYYVGDFRAQITSDKWNPLFVRSYLQQWGTDNYASTTRELKDAYPNFSSISTENRFGGLQR
jgi:hypothetical protein